MGVIWPTGPLGGSAAGRLVQHVVDAADTDGITVSVAVTDANGVLLAFERMDGTAPFSAGFALDKARTAATFAAPTRNLEELWASRQLYGHSAVAAGGYFLGRGGVPVIVDDTCWGAIGVSGAEPDEEEALAQAAADVAQSNARTT